MYGMNMSERRLLTVDLAISQQLPVTITPAGSCAIGCHELLHEKQQNAPVTDITTNPHSW